MKKKLITMLMLSIIILSFVGCTKDQVSEIEDISKNNTEVITIKDEAQEKYPYESGLTKEIKSMTNALHCTFAITDKTNLYITVEGDRAVLNANKQNIIEHLKKDTKYSNVTLIMHDEGSSVLGAFYNQRVK